MGWMNDTLRYFIMNRSTENIIRMISPLRCSIITMRILFSPLSHDEVVHGKGSLLNRMPGMIGKSSPIFAHCWVSMVIPGKILLFMGAELGQRAEWNANSQVDWSLLQAGLTTSASTVLSRI
jgi:1,4-alpha-glucan branching enzyme